jgi:hypothetical protein
MFVPLYNDASPSFIVVGEALEYVEEYDECKLPFRLLLALSSAIKSLDANLIILIHTRSNLTTSYHSSPGTNPQSVAESLQERRVWRLKDYCSLPDLIVG